VIGINFATTSGASNISFALPVNVVKSKLEEYRKFGKFIKPFIGVSYSLVSSVEATYYHVVAGALINSVSANSPASKSGLVKGDIIESINGTAITSSLQSVLQTFKVGQEVTLKVWRSGTEISLKVTLAESTN
jgi:serine protease Do